MNLINITYKDLDLPDKTFTRVCEIVGEPVKSHGLTFYITKPVFNAQQGLCLIEPLTGWVAAFGKDREELTTALEAEIAKKGIDDFRVKILAIADGKNLNPHLEA